MDFLSLTWWRKVFAKGGRVFAIGCAFAFIAPIVITAGFSLRQSRSNQPEVLGGTIATVNGDPISERDFAMMSAEHLGGAPGTAHAGAVGSAIYSLVVRKVVEQMAKKANIHASDADIDRAIAKFREAKVGANATDADWDAYVSDNLHTSTADLRDSMADEATIQAFQEHYKNAEKVTLDDARNQYSEVKLATVFIAVQSPTSTFRGAPKSLSDADALKKANELHASVLAGKDIIPMAKANPDPFSGSKATGISDWKNENQQTQLGSALFFGKGVDDAVHKTPIGKVTDVVKATGFQTGYFFAKVIDRRINTPKDYDPNKTIASLKEQQAGKKMEADVKAAIKAAKVVFPKDQPDKQAYYDYAKMEMMQQEMQGGMMGAPTPDAPTKTDIDAQKALDDADFEAALKAHPDDATATLMVAQALQSKMITAPPADQMKIRDRLISLYESAFKTTEDVTLRFTLAGLYKDKHDYKSAYKQYAMIIKLLNGDPPYDLPTHQKQLASRQQLLGGLKGLPAADVPEAAADIADQNAKISDLQVKIAIEQAKEHEKQVEEQRKQEADRKKAAAEAALKAKEKPNLAPSSAGAGTKPAPGAPPASAGVGTKSTSASPPPPLSGSNGASAPPTKP